MHKDKVEQSKERIPDTYWILYGSTMILFNLLGGLYVRGEENVPKEGSVLLVPNHTSYLDPCALGDASPRRVVFMGKAELFANKLFNYLLRGADCFPVKRGESDRSAIKASLAILAEGRILCLFPEGTRYPEGEMGKAEPGAVFLAERSGATLVPVYISGTSQMLDQTGKLHRARAIVTFGVSFTLPKELDREAKAAFMMEKIRETKNTAEQYPLRRIRGRLNKALEGSRVK